MKLLIVGLGNPGEKYLFTRHNIGFMVIDHLAERWKSLPFKKEGHALTSKYNQVLLVKPQKFMNLSGEVVQQLMNYYKIQTTQLLVLHDDLDLPFGSFRYQLQRGPGGHNGVKNIHHVLGTADYARIKIGIGRPAQVQMDVADYVLQNFSSTEIESLPQLLTDIGDSIEFFLDHGFAKTANQYN